MTLYYSYDINTWKIDFLSTRCKHQQHKIKAKRINDNHNDNHDQKAVRVLS